MQHQKSKAEMRHDRILQMLDENSSVPIAVFCETLGCSESTMRNDLAFLEREGKLRRIFGGAIRGDEQFSQNFKLSDRLRAYLREKEVIAKYILQNLLKPGLVICLDGSTTNEVLARQLAASDLSLTVLTNSLSIANIINQSSNLSLYMFGGYYIQEYGYFYDSLLNNNLSMVRADIYFMGVTGIREDGITCIGRDESSSKLALMKIASKTIVPADHSKFHQSGLSMLDDFTCVRTVVTDAGAAEKDYEPLKNLGVEVHLAKLE